MNRRNKRFLTSILALGLLLALTMAGLSQAQGPGPQESAASPADVGTAFTYQGHLDDGGSPANGSYDLQFLLYDALSGGSQTGSTVTKDDVTVTDGMFTVALDFGSVYDGTGLWLDIGVRPGSSTGNYTILSPRQEITPAPYAIHAYSAFQLAAADGDPIDAVIVDDAGNVGIGMSAPNNKLDIVGTLDVSGKSYLNGVILDNDTDITGVDQIIGYNDLHIQGNSTGGSDLFVESGGNVGIGTTSPSAKLDVNGDVAQSRTRDGLVKAAILAVCSDQSSAIEIKRQFNMVNGLSFDITRISYPLGYYTGRCRLNLKFDIDDRFWVTGGSDVCYKYSDQRLECTNYGADGTVSNGSIMVLVY